MVSPINCMVQTAVLRYQPCDLRDFLKAVVRKSEAAAGCEVLPTLTGRCVETPGRLFHASCPAAVSKRRTEGCSMVKSWPLFFRKLTSSNACAFWILEVHSAPEHLSQLPPPSFDGSYLLCSSEQGCDLDHSSMCDMPRIVGLVFCRDISAVEAA